MAWRGVCLQCAGRSNRPILRHKSGRNVPGWRDGGSRLEMPQAELVIKVQRVRAWPSSAFPSAGHVPAAPCHTCSCQATRGTGFHCWLLAVALCGTQSVEGPC